MLNYAPRTVRPDMVSLWPPTELTEGYNIEAIRENYVVTDGTRILQRLLRAAAPARRRHADGVPAGGEARDRGRPLRYAPPAAGDADGGEP